MKANLLFVSAIAAIAVFEAGLPAGAQVRSLSHCIVQASNDGASISFRNVCNETLHFQFEHAGGQPRRGGRCTSHGAYTFSGGAGPVGLVSSGCVINFWVCDMRTWNARGGRCN